ncbi:fimbrial biogenesis chaperone [Acinetobacter sp.]|uniref:fimbrial biogenesis chaperone n=1 Tax=Acinetobacter sp. TaxID=472 RepID=UPI003C74C965
MRNLVWILLCVCWMPLALAGVSIEGTRIIFPADSTSVGVQLRNEFSTPALVQVWIDNGNMDKMPAAEEIPFVLSPPLSRIEPKQGQIIRILQTDSSQLAEDRESLFWFNMLDIPPENPDLAGENVLTFTVRTRIKLFYRPKKLKMTVNNAFKNLQFEYLQDEQKVEIKNPTPYYITFANLVLKTASGDRTYQKSVMLSPFSSQKLEDFKLPAKPNQVSYAALNDLGGIQTMSKNMN